MRSRRLFIALLVAGALLRGAALPLPGTEDVWVWKIWTANAVRLGLLPLYGIGARQPDRRELAYHDDSTTVDYPPLSLVALAAAGHLYESFDREFRDTPGLVAAIKVPVVLAEALIAAILFAVGRKRGGVERGRLAALAYWLNPAALLNGAVLGYLDPLFALPAVASVAAAATGFTYAAGALLAAAVLTKAQALVCAPAVLLLLVGLDSRWEARALHLAEAATGGLAASCLVLMPYVTAGAWPHLRLALGRLATHDMLSAHAANAWWVVTWLTRAVDATPDVGAWSAFTSPTRILTISRAVGLGCPSPRLVGTVLVALAAGWGCWRARHMPDLAMGAGVGAFVVHAYFVLAAQVHENHLFLAVPLAVLAAAGRPAWRGIAAGLSVVAALNLNVFYGFGHGIGFAVPRGVTIVDASVVLAAANCALLAWHALVLAREGQASPPLDQPGG